MVRFYSIRPASGAVALTLTAVQTRQVSEHAITPPPTQHVSCSCSRRYSNLQADEERRRSFVSTTSTQHNGVGDGSGAASPAPEDGGDTDGDGREGNGGALGGFTDLESAPPSNDAADGNNVAIGGGGGGLDGDVGGGSASAPKAKAQRSSACTVS